MNRSEGHALDQAPLQEEEFMTARGTWLVLLGVTGLAGGIWLNVNPLAALSLGVLIWVFVEWVSFYARLRLELPYLRLRRSINGRCERGGILWAGRTLQIEVDISMTRGSLGAFAIVHDCVPENLLVTERASSRVLLTRTRNATLTYSGTVGGAGAIEWTVVKLTLKDAHGFFTAERAVPLPQTFRVLPGFTTVGDARPTVKRMNSLPQHGIHRLQRAGLGSELLELREYVPGDPPKSIAWKVSARRETLMTRQYESEVPVRVRLFIDGSVSTRIGGYGHRLLDQMLYVASTVARSSISAGDPVGAVLLDEHRQQTVPPAGGERGFYRLLEGFAEFATNPAPPPQRLSETLVTAATRLVSERHPELLDPNVNLVPFTFFPQIPWKRRRHYKRVVLANALAEIHGLSRMAHVQLIDDDQKLCDLISGYLAQSGVAWMDPLVQARGRSFHDGLATMQLLSQAITQSVLHARDNEVFVVFGNLLECASNISQLLPAVKLALARHHRLVVVCPTATFRRPDALSDLDENASVEDMIIRAEQLRTRDLRDRLQRALRRVGAACALSGEKHAVSAILAEAELARSGRTSFAGVR